MLLRLGRRTPCRLVGAGAIAYFAIAWFTGAMDKEDLLILLRRKKVKA